MASPVKTSIFGLVEFGLQVPPQDSIIIVSHLIVVYVFVCHRESITTFDTHGRQNLLFVIYLFCGNLGQ